MAEKLQPSLVVGEAYSFETLSGHLLGSKGQYFKVRQELPTGIFHAIMVMPHNDCMDFGLDTKEPILFYSDGDVCTADHMDIFILTGIHNIQP